MLTIVPKPVLPFNREKAVAVGAGKWYTLCREEPGRKCEAPSVAWREGGAVKALLLVAGAFFASAAFARQIVVPTLPVSPFADTEVSTNVVIHGGRVDVRNVRIHFQLEGTPTNNLEVAFGCDANTNGVLDVSEIETVYGWRGGRFPRCPEPAHRRFPTGSYPLRRADSMCRSRLAGDPA